MDDDANLSHSVWDCKYHVVFIPKYRLVWNAGKRAGLTRLASPHRLRLSYATHLLQGGADIRHIEVLLGRASLASTQVYLGIDVEDLTRMIDKSHPRERKPKE